MSENAEQITELLFKIKNGKQEALNDLLPLVYGELRRLAKGYLQRERDNPPARLPFLPIHAPELTMPGVG